MEGGHLVVGVEGIPVQLLDGHDVGITGIRLPDGEITTVSPQRGALSVDRKRLAAVHHDGLPHDVLLGLADHAPARLEPPVEVGQQVAGGEFEIGGHVGADAEVRLIGRVLRPDSRQGLGVPGHGLAVEIGAERRAPSIGISDGSGYTYLVLVRKSPYMAEFMGNDSRIVADISDAANTHYGAFVLGLVAVQRWQPDVGAVPLLVGDVSDHQYCGTVGGVDAAVSGVFLFMILVHVPVQARVRPFLRRSENVVEQSRFPRLVFKAVFDGVIRP
ncbi:hypothetical protein PG987_016565 [Apiospora arundinis]